MVDIQLGERFMLPRSRTYYTFVKDEGEKFKLIPDERSKYPFVYDNYEHAKDCIEGCLMRGTLIRLGKVKVLFILQGVTEEVVNQLIVAEVDAGSDRSEVIRSLQEKVGPAYTLGNVFIVQEQIR